MNSESTAYVNARVLMDGRFHEGHSVEVRDGRILRVGAGEPAPGSRRIDLDGAYLVPGFIDIQVNGGGGVLFNDTPTPEGIQAIARAHRAFGTTGLLPTLISDDLSVVELGLEAVDEAIDQSVPGVLGIHIEGPFLDVDRRGIHPAAKIREMTREWLEQARPLKRGKTLVTLAPEHVEPEWIAELVAKGFIVSAGHSNGNAGHVRAALAHGLTGFTHLYNAMTQLGSREPGVVGAALADRGSWCGLIADGHHVAAESMEIAFRCKGAEKLMLVTDAMPTVGSDKPEFNLLGTHIHVVDGACVDDNGTLAGAALDMATAVRNMAAMTTASLGQACQMGSLSPAAFLGLDHGRGKIAKGLRADFVILDEQMQVQSTIIGGTAF